MKALESALASLSFLEAMRPDEIGRIGRHFEVHELAEDELRTFSENEGNARLVVVVSGCVSTETQQANGFVRAVLMPSDRTGDIGLLTGLVRPTHVKAHPAGVIATLDGKGLDAILAEFPAIAEPLAREVASELAMRNDMMRQLLELHAAKLPPAELEAAVDERRRAMARHGAGVRRVSPRALFRRLVAEPGAEPPFWMLMGFLVALGGARLVVALILKYGLEKRLFALVPGNDPNPMHVHHFNYGLILIGATGLAALLPTGRRLLRVLSFAFGAGAGLVFDEFALFWNLNPEYAQPASLVAAGIVAASLVQLTYFRRFWGALGRRLYLTLGGGR